MTITQEIERLVKLFEEIEQYIMQMVANIIMTNPGAHSLRYWHRRAEVVHAELEGLRKDLLKVTPDVVSHAFKAGYIAGAAGEGHDQLTSGINTRAVALFAANMNDKLDASLATVGRRVDDTFRRAGLKSAALHATTGTAHEIARKQMTRDLQRQGVGAFVDKVGRTWTLKSYTSMVIRTTTREAMTQGTMSSMEDHGQELLKVSHHGSSCDICLKWDGKTFSMPNAPQEIKAMYPVLDVLPPFHPNFCPEFMPAGMIGNVKAACRAMYSGPLVVAATEGGMGFAVGPNHPVLTNAGWMPASKLRDGMYVLRRLNSELNDSSASIEDFNDVKAEPQDIFGSLSKVCDHARVPAAPSYLHGDGRYIKSEVEVVGSKRLLSMVDESHEFKQAGKGVFERTSAKDSLLTHTRTGGFDSHRINLTPACRPDLFLSSGAQRHASFVEALAYTAWTQPYEPRDLVTAFPGEIELDKVVSVNVISWQGMAFDFETSSSCYDVNGIITHNCKHSVGPASNTFDNLMADLEAKYGGELVQM